MAVEPDRTIDATGRYVMPGAVDVHTHMDLPFGGSFCSDDFGTGSRAAAFGGTTTIVDFALQDYGESLRTGLDRWHEKAQKSHIDYGFHMIVREVNDQVLKEMDTLVGEGVTSFKLFMAYPGVFMLDDGAIFQAMQRAADSGALIMMHAENGGPIDVLIRQYLGQGKTDPVNHSLTRPPVMEGEAVHRVFKMAELAGRPRVHRAPLVEGRPERGPRGTRPRRGGVRGDLSPVPLPLDRRHGPAGFRGCEVRLLAAAPDGRPSGRAVEGPAWPTTSRSSRPTTPPSTSGAEGPREGRLLRRSRTGSRRWRTGSRCSIKAWSTGGSA